MKRDGQIKVEKRKKRVESLTQRSVQRLAQNFREEGIRNF